MKITSRQGQPNAIPQLESDYTHYNELFDKAGVSNLLESVEMMRTDKLP